MLMYFSEKYSFSMVANLTWVCQERSGFLDGNRSVYLLLNTAQKCWLILLNLAIKLSLTDLL